MRISTLLESLAASVGDPIFIALTLALAVVLSFIAIPITTDIMVNSTAGLAGKYLGKRWRTLSINASTNNPEAFSMFVSFGMGRLGGWSNPLGSLFANIYLMFGVALVWVFVKFKITGQKEKAAKLAALLKREKGLLFGHLIMSLVMFGCGWFALQIFKGDGSTPPVFGLVALATFGLLAFGVISFFVFEHGLKKRRPELFDEVHDEDFNESWLQFFGGTAGVIASCYLMNELFVAWSNLYESNLSKVFGPLIFLWLHYFVGALITSLPEMTVAIKNFERCREADLNTAFGSTSYSNMVNLGIAMFGMVIWLVMYALGVQFIWG